jgi:hypothetical protein
MTRQPKESGQYQEGVCKRKYEERERERREEGENERNAI